MQKKAYKSEMVRDTAKDKCTAASKAYSNLSSEEYRQRFRIKLRGVSPSPALWRASCYLVPPKLYDTVWNIVFKVDMTSCDLLSLQYQLTFVVKVQSR